MVSCYTMHRLKKKLNIAVIDDNAFYNKLFCAQLHMLINHSFQNERENIQVFPFDCPDSFLMSSRSDFDLIFLDYFFYNNITASEAIQPIREKCRQAEIYLLSEWMSAEPPDTTILPKVDGYFPKDTHALMRCQEILTRFIPAV